MSNSLTVEWDAEEGKYFIFCFNRKHYFDSREDAFDYINEVEEWMFSDTE